MTSRMPLWGFTDLVLPARRARMLAVPGWSAVRETFGRSIPEFIQFESRHDPLRVGGQGARRASVRIKMTPDEADALYNSPIDCARSIALASAPCGIAN